VMAKMEAASLAELVRIVERLNRSHTAANSNRTAPPEARREHADRPEEEQRRVGGTTG